MPRINDNNYCSRHNFLRKAWFEFPTLFCFLRSDQQWEIHSYYQPSKELTDSQLREHRLTITKDQPSLPHRAGKAYAVMLKHYQRVLTAIDRQQPQPANSAPTKVSVAKGQRRVRAYGVVRPEPDVQRLASAVIDIAKQMARSSTSTEIKRTA